MNDILIEIVKHIPIKKYISGRTLGKDFNKIELFNGTEVEIKDIDLVKIVYRVQEKLKEYKFYRKSDDGDYLLIVEPPFYNIGESKAYRLAFNEIVMKQEVKWSEITNFKQLMK